MSMTRVVRGARALRYIGGPDTKPVPTILRELAAAAAAERGAPLHYLTHLLYRTDSPDPLGFVGYGAFDRIRRELLMPSGRPNACLEDKLHFARHLGAHAIPQPVLLRFTMNEQVFTPDGRPGEVLDGAAASWLRELIERTPTGAIFVKPVAGTGGKGCARLDATMPDRRLLALSRGWRLGNHLVQEAIDQHPAVAVVHPAAVNSMRVHTLRDPDGSVTLLSALIRFGRGDSCVDNVSVGGMYASVDVETGAVGERAQTFFVHGGERFSAHPETGVAFASVRLPAMADVTALVRQVASIFPGPVVGWDIALTASGPVVVEGNDDPHLTMAQVACGGFRSHAGWGPAIAGI